MLRIGARLQNKTRGQAIVEFVLALPILLFILFGIIEFARLTFAWMAVQNSARFGIRYAVTGEFNDIYCIQAGSNLGVDHINADVFGGDPQDCLVPDDFSGSDGPGKERELIDLARLFSIRMQPLAVELDCGSSLQWLEIMISISPAITQLLSVWLTKKDICTLPPAATAAINLCWIITTTLSHYVMTVLAVS